MNVRFQLKKAIYTLLREKCKSESFFKLEPKVPGQRFNLSQQSLIAALFVSNISASLSQQEFTTNICNVPAISVKNKYNLLFSQHLWSKLLFAMWILKNNDLHYSERFFHCNLFRNSSFEID